MKLIPKELSKKMRAIDFTMLTTRAPGGVLSARPMSNNGDVEHDGDSWFFTTDGTDMVAHIAADPIVGLTLSGDKGMLGKPGIFIAIEAGGADPRHVGGPGALEEGSRPLVP